MNLHDLNATELIGIAVITAILALAIIGFVKGLIRTVMALVCLGGAGYAALWGHEHAFDFTSSWSVIPSIWAPKIVGLATGIIVFFICQYILRFLVDPFNKSKTGQRIGFGLPAAALSLCAGLILIWLTLIGIRYAASLSELHDTRRMLLLEKTDKFHQTSILLVRARTLIDQSIIGEWQRKTDPFYYSDKLALSKLLVIYHDEPSRIKLLKIPAVSHLLNHPSFIKLAYSPDIKRYGESGKPREIYNSPALKEALETPEFLKLFKQIDLSQLLPPHKKTKTNS
jgi:hypothetical protein